MRWWLGGVGRGGKGGEARSIIQGGRRFGSHFAVEWELNGRGGATEYYYFL